MSRGRNGPIRRQQCDVTRSIFRYDVMTSSEDFAHGQWIWRMRRRRGSKVNLETTGHHHLTHLMVKKKTKKVYT